MSTFSVGEIFPPEALQAFNTSPLVKGLTPADFKEWENFLLIPGHKEPPFVAKLTPHDLSTIDGLFGGQKSLALANYPSHGALHAGMLKASSGASCCCCCTPCCSCSAAAETDLVM